jgi:hypothetical protein
MFLQSAMEFLPEPGQGSDFVTPSLPPAPNDDYGDK